MAIRNLSATTSGIAASDGDGVRLTRIIGSPELDMIDPFLMLDFFESDKPDDYIGGFPDHPHRGFETVTYLLAGRMRHWDNAGHEGVIEPGDVQWMSAGRGVIHSEMPEQEDGLLQGFQLWINLPAKDKMMAPAYQEFKAADIPVECPSPEVETKVIAGETDFGTVGSIDNPHTHPLFLDVKLAAGAQFSQSIPSDYNGFIFCISGSIMVGTKALAKRTLGVLGEGDRVEIISGEDQSRFLLVAARKLEEPVERGGPFVMNTREEVMQAFDDYKHGRF